MRTLGYRLQGGEQLTFRNGNQGILVEMFYFAILPHSSLRFFISSILFLSDWSWILEMQNSLRLVLCPLVGLQALSPLFLGKCFPVFGRLCVEDGGVEEGVERCARGWRKVGKKWGMIFMQIWLSPFFDIHGMEHSTCRRLLVDQSYHCCALGVRVALQQYPPYLPILESMLELTRVKMHIQSKNQKEAPSHPGSNPALLDEINKADRTEAVRM